MIRTLLLLLLAGTLLAPGCANTPPPETARTGDVPGADQAEERLEDVGNPEDLVSGVGAITYVDLEGGFYGLVADDGTKYNVINLEDAFKEDGLRVRFRGTVRDDLMTTRMWGRNLEVEEMLALTDD